MLHPIAEVRRTFTAAVPSAAISFGMETRQNKVRSSQTEKDLTALPVQEGYPGAVFLPELEPPNSMPFSSGGLPIALRGALTSGAAPSEAVSGMKKPGPAVQNDPASRAA